MIYFTKILPEGLQFLKKNVTRHAAWQEVAKIIQNIIQSYQKAGIPQKTNQIFQITRYYSAYRLSNVIPRLPIHPVNLSK